MSENLNQENCISRLLSIFSRKKTPRAAKTIQAFIVYDSKVNKENEIKI